MKVVCESAKGSNGRGENAPSFREKARRMRVKAFKMSERYAEEYGFDIQAIRGRDQRASIVAQRRVIAKLLRAFGFSFPAISRALNRDHCTIISYFEKTTLSEIALRRELSARRRLSGDVTCAENKTQTAGTIMNCCKQECAEMAVQNGVKGYFCAQCETVIVRFSADRRAFADAWRSKSGKSLLVAQAGGMKIATADRRLRVAISAYFPASAKKPSAGL